MSGISYLLLDIPSGRIGHEYNLNSQETLLQAVLSSSNENKIKCKFTRLNTTNTHYVC